MFSGFFPSFGEQCFKIVMNGERWPLALRIQRSDTGWDLGQYADGLSHFLEVVGSL